MLPSNEGALCSLDSSMFKTRLWLPIALLEVVPVLLELVELLRPAWLLLQLWLKRCQGTGINLPVVLY